MRGTKETRAGLSNSFVRYWAGAVHSALIRGVFGESL